jgi:hypothetical protein
MGVRIVPRLPKISIGMRPMNPRILAIFHADDSNVVIAQGESGAEKMERKEESGHLIFIEENQWNHDQKIEAYPYQVFPPVMADEPIFGGEDSNQGPKELNGAEDDHTK